jgi:lysophospholipase L1-like esterase
MQTDKMLLKNLKLVSYYLIFLLLLGCSSTSTIQDDFQENAPIKSTAIKILSLGDSYTIGQSVCEKCRFPEQLKDSLQQRNTNLDVSLQVIARTGWNTKNLINAIDNQNLEADFDLVTLLIGVNNQFQRIPFSTFENEFSVLIEKATKAANSQKEKLIVLSIPDYAFTPFGRDNTTISEEIETYNTYIANFCNSKNITFLNITDITQNGLFNTTLVASDGLHPSKEAYTKFVERILPIATTKLGL